jgi:DNA-binding NarL/FixJ family response regulator
MKTPEVISVLLAEDHDVVRQGICSLLRTDGHFQVVGEAHSGREAVAMAKSLRPDVILMDIAMPLLNGLEATRQIISDRPQAKVLILSAHSDDEYIERAANAGVSGFLEKQTSAEILTKAIREVASGKVYFSPSIAKRLSREASHRSATKSVAATKLTKRESEVLQLVAEGGTNKHVASELGISVKTVEKHRQHLMDKLGIHDTAGLTRFAISSGVIESNVQLTIIESGLRPTGAR